MRLDRLFEPKRFDRVYSTVRAELEAVRQRRKGMSFEVWSRSELDDADYHEFLNIALELDLAVVHYPTGKGLDDDVFVYVLHPDQHWRIMAHQTLRSLYVRFNGGWSENAEAYESIVLGYSNTQIAAWLATKRHERLGWGSQTVYLLLDDDQRATVARVRGRYLEPSLFEAGLELFVPAPTKRGERVVKRDAHRLVDRGITLARIAVEWPWFRRTFRGAIGSIAKCTLVGERAADALNAALVERVQALGDDGWSVIASRRLSAR